MLLFWSLLVPPHPSHPIPELVCVCVGGRLGEGGGRGQGLACRRERETMAFAVVRFYT